MKNMDGYLRRAESIFNSAYNDGYSAGEAKAKEEYSQSKGIAHVKRATPEDIERWGIELSGWCDCGNAINGRWSGLINFCPWCGKIIQWENPDEKAED